MMPIPELDEFVRNRMDAGNPDGTDLHRVNCTWVVDALMHPNIPSLGAWIISSRLVRTAHTQGVGYSSSPLQ